MTATTERQVSTLRISSETTTALIIGCAKGSGGGRSSFGQLGSCLLIVMSPTRNSWSPKK